MLLEELARHLVLQGVTEVSRQDAEAIVLQTAPSLPRLTMNPAETMNHLLARSGLLVEPASGRVQFVHTAFRDFLAARSFVESDMTDLIVARVHEPNWRSIAVLAAAQARTWQAESLIKGILERGYAEPRRRLALSAVLQECVASLNQHPEMVGHQCGAPLAGRPHERLEYLPAGVCAVAAGRSCFLANVRPCVPS